MNDSIALAGEDLERFLLTIDASMRISRRFQFFLWAQGILQRFIPHETLICTHGDLPVRAVRHEVFTRAVTDAGFDAAVHDLNAGFMMPLIDMWLRHDRQPLALHDGNLCHPAIAHLSGHGLCHGAPEVRGEQGSFFTFLGLPAPPGPRERYLLDLLMPHLHMALHRAASGEAHEPLARHADNMLSRREIQVLGWVRDGKTNHEIGRILQISPLTVKNHIQRILRKLKVCNRAQAVAHGVCSGIL